MDVPEARNPLRGLALLALLPVLALVACTPPDGTGTGPPDGSRPLAAVCGGTAEGPSQAPEGAVRVDPAVPGDLSAKTNRHGPATTFWLAPGTHRLGSAQYDQVIPKRGNAYVGAPGSVLDGQRANRYAFTGNAADVRVQHLTVRGFVAPVNEGVVNHDSADGWVIEHNTIERNEGAALMAGARQQVRGNCLRDNGQYGMNAYKADGSITGLVVEGNEIVGNNTADWESRIPECGCSGGVKFWEVNGADIRGNWVHDNRGPALWADTNNNDFLIEGNLIEDNDSAAIFYETSYNAVIRNNLLRRNNWVEGRKFADGGDSFPAATVYVSESGGEPRVPARTDKIEIYDNVLENNWSGITLWENADRFCNSPANTSSGSCTLLVPRQDRCSPPAIESRPLLDDCRWKTQRVDIHHNTFSLDTSVVGCEALCGRMAVLSNYGTYPDWSPYQGEVIQQAITFEQRNRWHDNTYVGPWTFMAFDTDRVLDQPQWQVGPYRQDRGSTFSRAAGG